MTLAYVILAILTLKVSIVTAVCRRMGKLPRRNPHGRKLVEQVQERTTERV